MSGKKPVHDEPDPAMSKPAWQRWAWLIGIWAGSVFALYIAASLMRMFMSAAGLTTH